MVGGAMSHSPVFSLSTMKFSLYDAEIKKQRQEKWDRRFLEMATLVSSWSKDPSTRCGAVIVRPDMSVCSVGFNGFPKNMKDDEELYADREKKYSRVVHCEVNALLHSVDPTVQGYTLYTVPFACCDRCAVQMLQSGITRFVNPFIPADKLERWGKILQTTADYYKEAGVEHVEY
jgi:dCMP deaminase